MKVLLVTMYFPPSGGGGVQRPLKFATHLPAHGIETHVLAPDDAKWIHSDPDLVLPTQAWIHRARYLGPRSRKLADELHGRQGLDRRIFGPGTLARGSVHAAAGGKYEVRGACRLGPRGE